MNIQFRIRRLKSSLPSPSLLKLRWTSGKWSTLTRRLLLQVSMTS